MKTRCLNTNRGRTYSSYGGRGITICQRWLDDFAAFLSDVGEPPDQGDYSLDRINNDGGYEPGNVRWATRIQQARNTRRTKLNEEAAKVIRRLGPDRQSIVAALHGITPTMVRSICRRGAWPTDRAVEAGTPS